jgi:hypothetical protein
MINQHLETRVRPNKMWSQQYVKPHGKQLSNKTNKKKARPYCG